MTRSSNSSDAGTTSRVFSTVLQFLNEDTGVFTIMTSNDVSQLPPELTRSGRLDARWYFPLPAEEEREEIYKIHIAKYNRNVSDDIIKEVSEKSEHYTGAEIEEVVKNAMRKAYKRYKNDKNKELTKDDLVSSINDVIPLYNSSREQISYLENWAQDRARFTNGKYDKSGFNTEANKNLMDDLEKALR